MEFTETHQASTLLEKLWIQREAGRFCDLIFHVQGEQFEAHQNVLAAFSPYFDCLFQSSSNGAKNELVILCLNLDAFQHLLKFLYLGTISIDQNNVSDLIALANHFQLDNLKKYCAEYLNRHVDETNCLNMLEMSEEYDLPYLQKNISDYIIDNIAEIFEQNEVLELNIHKLNSFLNCLKDSVPQYLLLKFICEWVYHDVVKRECEFKTLLLQISWECVRPKCIHNLIKTNNLLHCHPKCLYFLFVCLAENHVMLPEFQSLYNLLKNFLETSSGNEKDIPSNCDRPSLLKTILESPLLTNTDENTIQANDSSWNKTSPTSIISLSINSAETVDYPEVHDSNDENHMSSACEKSLCLQTDLEPPLSSGTDERPLKIAIANCSSVSNDNTLEPLIVFPPEIEKEQLVIYSSENVNYLETSLAAPCEGKFLSKSEIQPSSNYLSDSDSNGVVPDIDFVEDDCNQNCSSDAIGISKTESSNVLEKVEDLSSYRDSNCNTDSTVLSPKVTFQHSKSTINLPSKKLVSKPDKHNHTNVLTKTIAEPKSNFSSDCVVNVSSKSGTEMDCQISNISSCPVTYKPKHVIIENSLSSQMIIDFKVVDSLMTTDNINKMSVECIPAIRDSEITQTKNIELKNADSLRNTDRVNKMIAECFAAISDGEIAQPEETNFKDTDYVNQISVECVTAISDGEIAQPEETNFKDTDYVNEIYVECVTAIVDSEIAVREMTEVLPSTSCEILPGKSKARLRKNFKGSPSKRKKRSVYSIPFNPRVSIKQKKKPVTKPAKQNNSKPNSQVTTSVTINPSIKKSVAKPKTNIIWKLGVKCNSCSFIAHSSVMLKKHMDRIHTRNVTYKCNECDFTCTWRREHYVHIKTHFVGPPYRCKHCDFTSIRLTSVLYHNVIHTGERRFKCTECNHRTSSRFALKDHIRIHTGEKPYVCQVCQQQFARKISLNQHMGSHSKDRPFLCDECGFSSKYKSHLLSHKLIHRGKVFQCPDCSYSCPKKYVFLTHRRIHENVRPYSCQQCDRTFVEKSQLTRHEHIHSGVKSLKCEHCEYSNYRTDKLKLHVIRYHGENPKPYRPRKKSCDPKPKKTTTRSKLIKCDHCEYSNWRLDKLELHIIEYHGDDPKPYQPRKKSCDPKPKKSTKRSKSIKCDHCEYSNWQLDKLELHIIKYHGDDPKPYLSRKKGSDLKPKMCENGQGEPTVKRQRKSTKKQLNSPHFNSTVIISALDTEGSISSATVNSSDKQNVMIVTNTITKKPVPVTIIKLTPALSTTANN